MAVIDYPAGLRTPLQEGYGLQHVDGTLRTTMASGRTRQRQRFTNTPARVNVTWLFPAGQAQLFEAWYWAPFNRDAPALGGIQGGTVACNMPLRTPIGLRVYEDVTFVDGYEGPALVGGRFWRITATLEIARRPVLPPESLEYPQEILYASLFDRTMNQHWPKS